MPQSYKEVSLSKHFHKFKFQRNYFYNYISIQRKISVLTKINQVRYSKTENFALLQAQFVSDVRLYCAECLFSIKTFIVLRVGQAIKVHLNTYVTIVRLIFIQLIQGVVKMKENPNILNFSPKYHCMSIFSHKCPQVSPIYKRNNWDLFDNALYSGHVSTFFFGNNFNFYNYSRSKPNP